MSRWMFSGLVWLLISVVVCAGTYRISAQRGAYGSNVVNGNLVTAEGRLPRVYLGISVASPQNTIFGNTVKAFQNSIGIIYTAHNHIYHNNLYCPAFTSDPTNKWDNGYPSGGNYWRSYPGVDVKKGSSQDQPGSDGIGDTPHTIRNLVPSYPSGYDNYPLMKPWGSPAPPSHVLTVQSLPTGISFTVDGLSRTTPWTGTYSENASVSLVMPEIHGIYVWSHWQEDGYTNRTRIYVSTDNTTWTGVFGILGDINGDGTVNIGDILICAVAFGSEPGDLKWNPIADLDSNGIINILDLVKIGVNFGKTL